MVVGESFRSHGIAVVKFEEAEIAISVDLNQGPEIISLNRKDTTRSRNESNLALSTR